MTIFAQRRVEAARMALDTARYWLRDACKHPHDVDWRAHCILAAQQSIEKAELLIAAAEQMQERRAA